MSTSIARPSSRVLLPAVLLLVAGFVFIRSFSFGATAGLFPRMTSLVVIVGALLLLVADRLPPRLRAYVVESAELFGAEEDIEREVRAGLTDAATVQTGETVEANWGMGPQLFTSVAIIGYAVGSLLVGMLWVSPIFAYAYSSWSRHSLRLRAGLTAMAFLLALGFYTVLDLPIAGGWLLDLSGLLGAL